MDAPRMPFTLTYGISLLRRAHMLAMLALVLGGPVALILLLLPLGTAASGDVSLWSAAVAFFRDALAEDPSLKYQVWLLVAVLPFAALGLLGHYLARITVTPSGIDGYLPRWLGMGLFGQTGGRWQFAWSQIRRVRIECAEPGRGRRGKHRTGTLHALQQARLVIETDREVVRLGVFPWFVRGGPDHRLGLREMSLAGGVDARECLARSPLVTTLAAQGIAPEWTEQSPAGQARLQGYNLAHHSGMLAQLLVMGLAGAYALVDTFFLTHYAVLDTPPLWPFALAGFVAALGLRPLGRGAPRTERVAVAVLTGAALTAAVYPAMLRANAWTAEPQVVEYTAVAHGRFEAPGNAPPLDLTGYGLKAYWIEKVGEGGHHRFTLLEGVFGFRQLDLAPLYESSRAFYRRRRDRVI